MTDRSDRLLDLSSRLTGFPAFELRGTGMLDDYLTILEDRLPPRLFDALLTKANEATLLDDPALGPIARNLILMWYCGTWAPWPDGWTISYGAGARGAFGIISAEAYKTGLQWRVAGAHPAGAQQQGFGAWSEPPGASR